jgi:hypothetical protein
MKKLIIAAVLFALAAFAGGATSTGPLQQRPGTDTAGREPASQGPAAPPSWVSKAPCLNSGPYRTFAAAYAAAAAAAQPLLIVNNLALTANGTATLPVSVVPGAGSITQTGSYTLALNGPFRADGRAFSGFSPGQVTGLTYATPEMFYSGPGSYTAAFACAMAASRHVILQNGKTYAGVMAIPTHSQNGPGWVITGNNATIQPASTDTVGVTVSGTSAPTYANNNVIENLFIDMSNMTNAATSIGMLFGYSWGNEIRNIRVVNTHGVGNTLPLSGGAGFYLTTFTNCNFQTIHLEGIGSDEVTTITFITLDGSYVKLRYCSSITFLQPVLQQNSNKFDLAKVSGLTILGGDIEGSGTYLTVGAAVYDVRSIGNTFSGVTTYLSGTIGRPFLVDNLSSPDQKWYLGGHMTYNPVAGSWSLVNNGHMIGRFELPNGTAYNAADSGGTQRQLIGKAMNNIIQVGDANAPADMLLSGRGKGILVTSPDGKTTKRIGIDNTGALSITSP